MGEKKSKSHTTEIWIKYLLFTNFNIDHNRLRN